MRGASIIGGLLSGAAVLGLVRDGAARPQHQPCFRFRQGDAVVLVGDRDSSA